MTSEESTCIFCGARTTAYLQVRTWLETICGECQEDLVRQLRAVWQDENTRLLAQAWLKKNTQEGKVISCQCGPCVQARRLLKRRNHE